MALFGGKPLSRLDELKKIVAKDPSSRQFLALAEEYRKLGRLREAMETLEHGIQAIPGYVAAYVALGRTYQQMGLPDQAIVAYGSALKFDRENLVAIRQIADAYLKKGEKVEAIKKLKLFRALKSGDPEVEQLIQQLDAELNPPRPKSTDAWPTAGGLRAPASPFASRPAPQPIPSALPEPSPARFEPIRPPLETSGAFARRDYPKPPDFSAAPYPKDRQSAFSSGGSAFAPPPPGVEEPSPMPTGRPEAPGAMARVEPLPRPGPPPTPPPRPLLANPPAASPFVAFDALVEPRPLPRREAPPSGLPTGIGSTTGSVTVPERTGPIGRARIPDPAELLELTFDGALRRTRVEPGPPVTSPVAPAAEVPGPAPRREQTTAPVHAPPVEPMEVRSRPITLPIPEVEPVVPPSQASWTSAPPPTHVEEERADPVFDFEEEVEPPLLAPEPEGAGSLDTLDLPVAEGAGEPFPAGTDAAVHELVAEPEPPVPVAEAESVLEPPSEPSPFESEPAPVVTETLAELYRAQGHAVEARDTYGVLAAAEPDEVRARELEARAAALSERLERSRGLRQWASRLTSPPPAEIESLGEVLDALISGTEGVRAASLTDLEGLPVVSAGEPVMETLIAEVTAFWKGVQRVRDDLGAGPLKYLTFTAGDGAAIVAAASPEYSLILRTDRDVPLGRIRYEVGRVSALLRPVLG